MDELLVRGTQAFAALAERQNWTALAKLPTDADLLGLFDRAAFDGRELRTVTDVLEHFNARRHPKFFAAFDDRERTVAELRKRWPEADLEVVTRADRICAGRFDLLGFESLHFGDPIDWHLEPVAGKRAPLEHWSRLDFLDAAVAGDKKIIWELNRQQFFSTLGQAYWLTGHERYAEAFVRQLESWMDQNPPKRGINWASSLEVSFRSISWLWAIYFFNRSPVLAENVFARFLKFLYLHARHIETYLSTYFSPNTHLTGEALGLFCLGTLLPEFKEAARWKDRGRQILIEQLDQHVQPDGVYFEQSSYYHRYTADFYIHFLILLRANGEDVSQKVETKLKGLLDHLMYITRPDGTTPLVGDDDGGRLIMLERRPSNDFRATLATGAALFARGDYKFVSGSSAETLWLLGPDAMQALDQLKTHAPPQNSVAFADSGYYVMRDDWEPTANFMLFDCGPHGTANCGHAHADALSFDLAANGHTMLIDPGTYTYTGSKQFRDWFRSSFAHNTLTVDGESSSEPSGTFSWHTVATSRCLTWVTQARFDYLVAGHDGYRPLAVSHTRSVLFLKKDYWILRDQITSAAEREFKLWFHFGPDMAPLNSEGDVSVISGSERKTRLQVTACAPGGEWTTELGWASSCYGEKAQAPVFAFTLVAAGATEIVTFLLPQTSEVHSRPVIREIEATGGRAFEINVNGKHDALLLRGAPGGNSGRIETSRLGSDFEVTWARFANNQGRLPDETVLLDGQSFEVDGRSVVNAKERIDSMSATRFGEEFV